MAGIVLHRVGAILGAVLVLVAVGPPVAFAAPETQPPEQACRYNDQRVRVQKLPPAAEVLETWPQKRLRYADAWRFGRGTGVVVAVVDSGVDAGHEQLRGHVMKGWDLTTGLRQPGADTDCAVHGTLVAGMIAARPVPGRGFAGIAPDSTILPVRQTWGINANRQPILGSPTNLLKSIKTAVDARASVINVSVTVPANELNGSAQSAFRSVAAYAAARNVLIVTSTGNKDENGNANVPTFPAALAATYDNVIAVGGIGEDGKVDSNSITGPFVTVVAPDRDMPCAMVHGGLVPCLGTSFAAPFVSGLAALLRARFPTMTAAEVKRRIMLTADHPSTDLPNEETGYGVINPLAAMTAVLSPPGATPSPAAAGRPLPPPPAADVQTRTVALAVAAGSLLVALVVGVAAVVLPRGRRRRWRPGRRPDLPADSTA